MDIQQADLFEFTTLKERQPIVWPNGARLAFWAAPNVMWYELLPPENKHRDPWPRTPHPDVRSYSHQDYGNRVGFWRMLEVLAKHDIKCTTMLNVAAIQHMPEVREAILSSGWEILAHGIYNTRFIWDFTEQEERAFYRDIVETIYSLTGRRVKGFMGPGPQSQTTRTQDLLVEAGFTYFAGFYHDDQPFPIKTKAGRLISIPYSDVMGDSNFLLREAGEGDQFAERIKRQFDRLYREGGSVMSVSLHPYICGQPHRIKYLDQAMAYIASHKDVWFATAEEIVDYYVANHLR